MVTLMAWGTYTVVGMGTLALVLAQTDLVDGRTQFWLSLFTLLTLIAGGIIQFVTQRQKWNHERRNREQEREWKKEDRKIKAQQLRESRKLGKKIEENTKLTLETQHDAQEAYKEANDVNRKIAEVGIAMKDDAKKLAEVKHDTEEILHEVVKPEEQQE